VNGLLTYLQLSNKQVIYKELKLKHYKTLLKCLIGDQIDVSNLLLNVNNILQDITNLTLDEILNLNLLEYLLLLTEIRITSIGSTIFAVSKSSKHTFNIEIPLNKTLDEIKSCINNYEPLFFKNLNFVIPLVKDIVNKKEFLYIKEDVTNLPVRYLKDINQGNKKFNSYFQQYYFFNLPTNKQYSLKLSVNLKDFIELIKILYNENLISIYDNIYYLSKLCNFSAEYLENCTYGEFKIFVKKTESILQKKIKPLPPIIEPLVPEFDPVDINSLYGNNEGIDTNITSSEFTP
jgi:hypothetical protein